LSVTDAKSRNGTHVRGAPITPHVATPVALNEPIRLGEVTVFVCHRSASLNNPDDLGLLDVHGPVAQHLERECGRSGRTGSPFTYLQVQVDSRAAETYDLLRTILRDTDVITNDGRGQLDLLLLDTGRDRAAMAINRISRLLAQADITANAAMVSYPDDGITAEQLSARIATELEREPGERTTMDEIRELMAQVARGEGSVLVTGEPGVGKELAAETIHRLSRRAHRPFVKIDCSRIPEAMIEGELFGYEGTSASGTVERMPGVFEAGEGGTVFVDEICDLPADTQQKLLRVLEERVVRRIGSTSARALDIRFICATHRPIGEEVAAGRFRRELYYRINSIAIQLPALRERKHEIAPLARAFAARARASGVAPVFEADVLEAFDAHPWPGNIGELRNTVERAVVLAGWGPIKRTHIAFGAPADSIAAERERRRIQGALERCEGNQTRAAHVLGLSRNTFLARLDANGLARPG
jgi:transcriptional regulator with AAA-type ATPase domain